MLKSKWYFLPCLILAVAVFSALSFAADDDRQLPDIRTFTGQLQILIADNFDTGVSERRYAIREQQADGGFRYLPLSFASIPPDSTLRTGDRVVVEGRLLDNTIVVYSLEQELDTKAGRIKSTGENNRYAPLTIGDRNAVVLIVNMNDAENVYRTSDLAAMMYTDERNVNGLYQASSGRQLSFVPDTDGDGEFDVFGPFSIDHSANENCTLNNPDYPTILDNWAAAADEAARNQGIDLTRYQHHIYFLPFEVNCGWDGMGTVGCPDNLCRAWVIKSRFNSDEGRVIAHELGHNLNWQHASSDPDNDGIMDEEYGDHSGIMGIPHWAQANAPHRDQLEWFDTYPGTLVEPVCNDTFRLDALELDPGVDSVETQVVKIPIPDTHEYYYLSYRRQIGNYPSHPDYADKINIHRYAGQGALRTAHIINLEQGDPPFEDSENGITVTATTSGGTRAAVAVEIPGIDPTANFSSETNYLDVIFIDNSSDEDGSVASRRWDFGDGTTSTDTDPSHTYENGGTYTVTLTVTDNCGYTDSAEELVLVEANEPPVAGFTYGFINNLNVQFTDASTDKENAIESRLWDFGDGTTSPDDNPSHRYSSGGTYTVTLTVTDERRARDSESIDIEIIPNAAPTADFSFSVENLNVRFTDASLDDDGTITERLWAFGDGATSDQVNPSHTYASGGTYTVTLTVTDDDGASHAASEGVTIEASIMPSMNTDFTFEASGLTVQFSESSAGSIASRQWDFGDGNTSEEAYPSHTYTAEGTYTVQLTVTYESGGSDTISKEVNIESELVTPDQETTGGGGGGGGGGCFIKDIYPCGMK